MQSETYKKFLATGIVPVGFAATIETPITITRERGVQDIIVITASIVREKFSVKRRHKYPVEKWQLFPINSVPSITVKPSGETVVQIYDLTRR